jgi:signal transduction histidine kinase
MQRSKARRRTIKLARQISIFLLTTLLLAVIITGLFFTIITNKTLEWLHEKELSMQAAEVVGRMELYLENRLSNLRDISSLPILSHGVMQREGIDDDLHDFMGRLKVLGEDHPIALLDYAGNIIHTSGDFDKICAIANPVEEVVLHERSVASVCLCADEINIILAVPVYYQTRSEGMLMIIISLEELAEGLGFDGDREHASLSFYALDRYLGSFGADMETRMSVRARESLTRLDLVLMTDVLANRADILSRFYWIGGVIILVIILFSVAAYYWSLFSLVRPIEALRRATYRDESEDRDKRNGELDTTIREIQDLHGDFEAMMVRIDTREKSLVEARNELSEVHRRLRLWDGAKRQWLGNLSHQLRTPLTGLFGLCDHLFTESVARAELKELEGDYQKMRVSMEKMLNDASMLTYIDASTEDMRFEPVAIGLALTGALDELYAHSVSYRLNPKASDLLERSVLAEAALLQRAISNLLQVLGHCIGNQGEVEIALLDEKEVCRLVLAAAGDPLSEQEINLFFEPGGERNAFKAGEEFGLSAQLGARIIEIFNGRVDVYNKKDKIVIDIKLPFSS